MVNYNVETAVIPPEVSPPSVTNFEGKLYLFLWVHKDTFVSKAALTDHLYPSADAQPESNCIEIFVARLRKKGVDIKTKRGCGYKLVLPEECIYKCDVCNNRPAVNRLRVAGGTETSVCDECVGPDSINKPN